MVEINNTSNPYFERMPYTIIINALVGSPIWTRLLPKNEIIKPAITAVINPFSSDTLEATAKTMAKGTTITPTTIPESKSEKNCFFEYPSLRTEKNFGLNIEFKLKF